MGDLQPIGIDVLHVSFVISPICLQPTHIVEKSSSISVMDNAMRLISNTPLYVHRIIMKKRNCLRQNTLCVCVCVCVCVCCVCVCVCVCVCM